MSWTKKIMPVILTVLILGLPFVSWYYLDTGLQFRKGLEAETKPKSNFENSILGDEFFRRNVNLKNLLKNKTTIIANCEADDFEKLFPIYDQYKKVSNFQVVSYCDEDRKSIPEYIFIGIPDLFPAIQDELYLIDTSMSVIEKYSYDEASLKKLIQHIAVVLPRRSDRDISIKK